MTRGTEKEASYKHVNTGALWRMGMSVPYSDFLRPISFMLISNHTTAHLERNPDSHVGGSINPSALRTDSGYLTYQDSESHAVPASFVRKLGPDLCMRRRRRTHPNLKSEECKLARV